MDFVVPADNRVKRKERKNRHILESYPRAEKAEGHEGDGDTRNSLLPLEQNRGWENWRSKPSKLLSLARILRRALETWEDLV